MDQRRLAVAILALVASLSGCNREPPARTAEREETLVPVGAVRAETAGIRAVLHVSGIVVPAEGAEFLAVPPEPARIVEITKSQGDPVARGEVLVRFDLPSATQDVARVAADVAGAEAQLESARINESRVRDFVEKGLVPRRDLEGADRELADAQMNVNRLRAALASAEAAASRAVIRAPFSGIVATKRYEAGDFVTSTSDPVLRVVDPRRLDVIASVPETEVARVVPGATARIAGRSDGQPTRLTVASRLPVDRTTGNTVPVRLTFTEPPTLPVDTRIEVDVDAEERADSVLLPAEAVLREGGQTVVFIADESRAQRRVVTTGITDDARVEITSGVKPGELVITRGHVGLTDGTPISVDIGR